MNRNFLTFLGGKPKPSCLTRQLSGPLMMGLITCRAFEFSQEKIQCPQCMHSPPRGVPWAGLQPQSICRDEVLELTITLSCRKTSPTRTLALAQNMSHDRVPRLYSSFPYCAGPRHSKTPESFGKFVKPSRDRRACRKTIGCLGRRTSCKGG